MPLTSSVGQAPMACVQWIQFLRDVDVPRVQHLQQPGKPPLLLNHLLGLSIINKVRAAARPSFAYLRVQGLLVFLQTGPASTRRWDQALPAVGQQSRCGFISNGHCTAMLLKPLRVRVFFVLGPPCITTSQR